MTGTLINAASILLGGALGLLLGSRIPARLRETVIAGLGLFTTAYGIKMFLTTQNSLAVLGSLLIGVLLGEWWRIEDGIKRLGEWLNQRFARQTGPEGSSRFIIGFFTSSLLFCIGPMAILGSIQDGLTGDYQTLVIKSILDGFAALAFASSMGVGVLFSAGMVFLYQGSISLLASQVQAVVSDAMMVEMSAVGGVILIAIGISNLLEIKQIRTGNFLPALIIAPIMVLLMQAVGVY
jgi:uncharacterized membrane protein YqgA involved in biofilm formation